MRFWAAMKASTAAVISTTVATFLMVANCVAVGLPADLVRLP